MQAAAEPATATGAGQQGDGGGRAGGGGQRLRPRPAGTEDPGGLQHFATWGVCPGHRGRTPQVAKCCTGLTPRVANCCNGAETGGVADEACEADDDADSVRVESDGGDAADDADSVDDTESASVAVDTDDSATERMRAARERACAKAGRLARWERAALLVSSYAVWRSVRQQRRRAAQATDRFRLRAQRRPEGTRREEADAALRTLLGEQLEEPPPPAEPPPTEPETRGDGDEPAQDLPRCRAWWDAERERQQAEPFRAGRVQCARLRWQPGMRPTPPEGCYYAWGPTSSTTRMGAEERAAFIKALAKDVRSGALVVVAWEDVDVVTPMQLVQHPVTQKWRLVHDARAINARLVASTVRLPRPADALLGLSWGAKLDISQAFRHVGTHPDDARALCVIVDGIPMCWRALSFGISHSPELFAHALEVTLAAVRAELPAGTAIVVYVDDILIVAKDRALLDEAALRLLQGLRGGGWQVALDKCFLRACSAIPFLGLIVDLSAGRLRVSRAKAQRLADICDAALRRQTVSLRELQRVGGLLAFFAAAAPEAGFARAGVNAATAEAERLPGRTVGVKGQLREDLSFWAREAVRLPDMAPPPEGSGGVYTVCTDHSGLPTLAWGGVVWPAGQAPPDIDGGLDAVRSATARAVPGAGAGGASQPRVQWLDTGFGGGFAVAGPTATADASQSSAALEVRALREVLQAARRRFGRDFWRGRRIRWLCDAQVAVGAVGKWRAKAEGLARELHNLLRLVRALGCTVSPEWVSREAGWQPVADALSKLRWQRSSAEWRMADADRESVLRRIGGFIPTIDLFAAAGAAAYPAFVSRWPEPGATWCDAFSTAWSGLRAWAFPPYAVAAAALRHAARSKDFEGVFVIPRETAVPAGLRVVAAAELPPLSLIDCEGRRPDGVTARALRAVRVRSGAA